MDLRDLCRLYRGSPWPDERGRAGLARQHTSQADATQRTLRNQPDYTDFAIGYDAMYRGDYRVARSSFQRVTGSQPSELSARTALYSQFARLWSVWPPSLPFLSDYGSVFAILASVQVDIKDTEDNIGHFSAQVRKNAFDRLGQIPNDVRLTIPDSVFSSFITQDSGDVSQPGFAGLLPEHTDIFTRFALDQLEINLLKTIWQSLRVRQLVLGPLISQSVGTGPISGQDLRDQQLSTFLSSLLRQRKVAENLSLHHLVAHLDLLYYELHRIESMDRDDWSDTCASLLNYISTQYQELDDIIGIASVLMCKAELYLSPPYTSPLALNLIITDSMDATLQNQQWDKIEASILLIDSQNASENLRKAFELFDIANSSSGRGLVRLYEGCIAHMGAMYQQGLSNEERERKYDFATKAFEFALEAFDHRDQFYQLVLTHQVLVSISRGQSEDLVSKCELIGSWANSADNLAFGQFLGFLIAKFGRRAWLDRGRADIALLSYSCAISCLRQVPQLSVAVLQVLGSSMELYLTLSDHKKSRALANDFHAQFSEVISSFRKYGSGTRWSETIRHVALHFIRASQNLLARAYYATKDEKMIIQWISELRDLEAEFNEGQELEARKRNPYLIDRYERGAEPLNDSDYDKKTWEPQRKVLLYYLSDIQYERHLQNYNILAAEKTFEEFLVSLAAEEELDDRILLAVHVCCRLEKYELGRSFLHIIHDDALFRGEVDLESNLNRPWSNSAHEKRLFFPEEASKAISYCVEAQHWQRGKRILELILSKSTGFLSVRCSERDQDDMWHRFLHVGLIAEFTQCPDQAFTYYIKALQSFELRNNSIHGQDARLNSLYTEASSRLFNALARSSIKLGALERPIPHEVTVSEVVKLQCSTWNLYALIFLEMGKARSLLETKSFQVTLKHLTGGDTVEVYQKRLLQDLQAIPVDQRTVSEVEEINSLQAELQYRADRDHPQVGTTISPVLTLEFASFDFIAIDAAVIEFSMSRDGLVLACITHDGIQHLTTHSMTSLQGQRSAFEYLHTIFCRESGHQTSSPKSPDDEAERLRKLAMILSEHLLHPIHDVIQQKSHLIFVPSHPIIDFPFSGLIFDGEPLFRRKAVSQAPSLATLRAICSSSPVLKKPRVASIAKPGQWMDRTSNEGPLYMAGLESLFLGRMFGTTPLQASDLTRADFLNIMQQNDIVHIGTHGELHKHSPWQASISLASKLRVIDLMTSQSQAALLVFGACLAGIGKATAGNDVTGFAHALLASGARAFIGALWRIDDISTMLLMREFFSQLSQSDGSLNIAELWRRAQCKLYDLDDESLRNLRATLIQDWDQMVRDGLEPKPGQFVPKGKTFLKLAGSLEDLPSTLDATHPFHWAAFTIVGNGDLRFNNVS